MLFTSKNCNAAAENLAAQIYKEDPSVLSILDDLVAGFDSDDMQLAEESLERLNHRAKVAYLAAAAFHQAVDDVNKECI